MHLPCTLNSVFAAKETLSDSRACAYQMLVWWLDHDSVGRLDATHLMLVLVCGSRNPVRVLRCCVLIELPFRLDRLDASRLKPEVRLFPRLGQKPEMEVCFRVGWKNSIRVLICLTFMMIGSASSPTDSVRAVRIPRILSVFVFHLGLTDCF